tara:strand:+ start:176 stop:478 length:303 start_codon:yes stop_codon:yes gene_type:complete
MKNKFEKDFYESRDTWWSIQDQIENDADQNTVQKLNHIMELSLYNQRDMLIEIDNLKSEIIMQKRPQLKKIIEKQKKRDVRFSGNPILEKVDYYLLKLRS